MNHTKYKWMLFLVIILLVSNMILAFFLFFANNRSTKKKMTPEEWSMKIYNEIGLDSTQVDIFFEEKDAYFEAIGPVWNENKKAKESLYQHLSGDLPDSTVSQLLEQIKRTNHFSDSFTYKHFVKLRALCTPEQQIRFDTIMPKLVLRQRGRK
jgi:hypothetical protein